MDLEFCNVLSSKNTYCRYSPISGRLWHTIQESFVSNKSTYPLNGQRNINVRHVLSWKLSFCDWTLQALHHISCRVSCPKANETISGMVRQNISMVTKVVFFRVSFRTSLAHVFDGLLPERIQFTVFHDAFNRFEGLCGRPDSSDLSWPHREHTNRSKAEILLVPSTSKTKTYVFNITYECQGSPVPDKRFRTFLQSCFQLTWIYFDAPRPYCTRWGHHNWALKAIHWEGHVPRSAFFHQHSAVNNFTRSTVLVSWQTNFEEWYGL